MGNNIKLFNSVSDQNAFRNGLNYVEPHVSCTIDGENVQYNRRYDKEYLTVTALENGYFNIRPRIYEYEGFSSAEMSINIDYKVNNGSWEHLPYDEFGYWDYNTPSVIITVSAGDNIYFRGTNNYLSKVSSRSINEHYYINFGSSYENHPNVEFKICGNILSLFYGDNFTNYTMFPTLSTLTDQSSVGGLFSHSELVSAKNLILPNEVENETYQLPAMEELTLFSNCQKLVDSPKFPATTLATGCYCKLFWNCTSLVNAPELPAENIENACYTAMFYGCTSLQKAPDLIATRLSPKYSPYASMFQGCSSLNYVKCLATDPNEDRLYSWLDGVSATGTFIKKNNVNWSTGVSGIPSGWTVETVE